MSIHELMEIVGIKAYPLKEWVSVIGIQSRERRLILNEVLCKDILKENYVIPERHIVLWFESNRKDYHADFKRFIQMEFAETLIPN